MQTKEIRTRSPKMDDGDLDSVVTAIVDAASGMVQINDAYLRYVRRYKKRGRSDPIFDERMERIDAYAERAKAACGKHEQHLPQALKDVMTHLVGAASAYREYARRKGNRGRSDPFYVTRAKDFHKATDRTLEVCKGLGVPVLGYLYEEEELPWN